MNCCKCGEEIREPAAYLCEKCLKYPCDSDLKGELRTKGVFPLKPREAIIAMLDGATLISRIGNKVLWDPKEHKFREFDGKNELRKVSTFRNLSMENRVMMGIFEILAWVNSPESQGWMVRRKYIGNDYWDDWDIPQRFRYDTQEEFGDLYVVEYQRARMLPDKSGVDESTIQGFIRKV